MEDAKRRDYRTRFSDSRAGGCSVRKPSSARRLRGGHSGLYGLWSSSPVDWVVMLVKGAAAATPSTLHTVTSKGQV
jgi:hypothetical protein